MVKMMRPVTALTVPVIAALVVAGCGGSSGSPKSASSSKSPRVSLARAADVSAAESGYTMTMSMHESLGSEGNLTASGSGSFSTAQKSGTMTLEMKVPSTSLPLGNLQMKMILRGENFYMKLPSSLSSLMPGGKAWMALNFGELGKAASLPGLGSLINSEGSLSDPGQYLNYLKATSASGIQNLGTETIDGVQTTHFRAELDLAHLASAVPASERAAAAQLAAQLEKRAHLGTAPIDAWIDSSNRVRRIALNESMTITVSGKSQPVTLALTEDFTSYGPQPVPSPPPADQTIDLTTLLHGL